MFNLLWCNYYNFCPHDADFLFEEDVSIGLVSIHFFVNTQYVGSYI